MMEVSGLIASNAPAIQNVLTIGRGGASIVAASISTSMATSSAVVDRGVAAANESSSEGIVVTPQAKAVFLMAIAMAFHYLGYSIARPVTVALFTSETVGYGGSAAAFPFAMAFVSPISFIMLMGYGRLLARYGPRGTLTRFTTICATMILASATGIGSLQNSDLKLFGIPVVKFLSGPLFVVREGYVQLLTSQYWAFMASSVTPAQSATWFGPIAGLTSISSAVGGYIVSGVVQRFGLSAALMGTGFALLASLIPVTLAYNIADKHGFSPKDTSTKSKKDTHDDLGIVQKAKSLFARVPILYSLFCEILAAQGLATILNVCFVAKLGSAITDDAKRAGWVGGYYALINVITMMLQFGVLPPLMSVLEPKMLWRVVPLIALAFTSFQSSASDPSLRLVSLTLLVMKVLEYSARRMLDEMVYVALDYESRYVGKEVLSVFGYRFGKSLMSLGLSGLTALFGDIGVQQFSVLSVLANLLWSKSTWTLSNMVPSKKEAEETYQSKAE